MKQENKNTYHAGEKRKGTSLKRWHKVLLIVVAVILVVAIGVFGFVWSKLGKLQYVPATSMQVDISSPVELDDDELGDLPAEGEYEEPIVLPEGDVFQDKDVVNILILGTDERATTFSNNARADSIILLSLNKRTESVKLVSFQRGTAVPVPGREDDWLTHTFRYGGADLTVATVEECFAIEIEGYLRINFTTFEQLINTIGGVDIELTAVEANALNGIGTTNAVAKNTVSAGWNHLDGYDALQYSRLRYTDSDWTRIERQRTVIKSAISEIKDLSIPELLALMDTTLPLVQTNLSNLQIVSLITYSGTLLKAEIQEMSLPRRDTITGLQKPNGQVLNVTDFAINREILHEFLAS